MYTTATITGENAKAYLIQPPAPDLSINQLMKSTLFGLLCPVTDVIIILRMTLPLSMQSEYNAHL